MSMNVIRLPEDMNLLQWRFNLFRLSLFPTMFKEDAITMVDLASYFTCLIGSQIEHLPEDVSQKYAAISRSIPMLTGTIKDMVDDSKRILSNVDKVSAEQMDEEGAKVWKKEVKEVMKWLKDARSESDKKIGEGRIDSHIHISIYLGSMRKMFLEKGMLQEFISILENAVVVLDLFYQSWCLIRSNPAARGQSISGVMEIKGMSQHVLYLYLAAYPESQIQFNLNTAIMYDMNEYATGADLIRGAANQQIMSAISFKDIYSIFGYWYKYSDDPFQDEEVKKIYEDFVHMVGKSMKERRASYSDSGVVRMNKEGKRFIVMH